MLFLFPKTPSLIFFILSFSFPRWITKPPLELAVEWRAFEFEANVKQLYIPETEMQNFLSYRRDETCMLNVCENSDEESLFCGQDHHRTDALLQLQHLQASNHCLGNWVQLQVQSNPIFNQLSLCPLFCFVGVGIHEGVGVLGGDHGLECRNVGT